jgi:hypothetical protein
VPCAFCLVLITSFLFNLSLCRPIKIESKKLLNALFASQSPVQVAQFMCNITAHDKEQIRVTTLKMLAETMDQYCVSTDYIAAITKK